MQYLNQPMSLPVPNEFDDYDQHLRCTLVLSIKRHGDKPIANAFAKCLEDYAAAVRSGYASSEPVQRYLRDFGQQEVFVKVETINKFEPLPELYRERL